MSDLLERHDGEFAETFEQICSLVGEDSAWKICELFAGEQVTFPKSLLRYRRNHEIRRKFQEGANYLELAREYGLTTRRIRHIVHSSVGSDAAYSQLDLF